VGRDDRNREGNQHENAADSRQQREDENPSVLFQDLPRCAHDLPGIRNLAHDHSLPAMNWMRKPERLARYRPTQYANVQESVKTFVLQCSPDRKTASGVTCRARRCAVMGTS